MSRSYIKALFLGLCLTGLGAVQARDWSRTELQKLYVDHLQQEGYRPTVDKDGDVDFKKEGRTYFIQVNEDDQQYFRLVLANFWELESPEEALQVLKAANQVTSETKALKVYTVEGKNTWASVELLLNDPQDFKGVLRRALQILEGGITDFKTIMKGNATSGGSSKPSSGTVAPQYD